MNHRMQLTLLAVFSSLPGLTHPAVADDWRVTSPDKKIVVTISNGGATNRLTYAVTYAGKPVIASSPLGIDRDDQPFTQNLSISSTKTAAINETYALLAGKRLQCRNQANELTLTFENPNKATVDLIVRAYNDGMAFRYHFPQTDARPHKILAEASGFAIPGTAKAWISRYDMNSRKKPCYEAFYESNISVTTPSPNPAGWAFPALFSTNGLWVLLTEAALDETYCATHLESKANDGLYTIRFPEKEEVTSAADPEPVSTLPWTTPWRVAVIGPSLATIQETNVVTALNPPSRIKDTSWIKPGRGSWSWWSEGSSPRSFVKQKEYVDFTAGMGWEYVLIDAGWPLMTNGNMADLVKYAETKKVGVLLWYHSGMGREKDTLSMANLMAFPESRKAEFDRIQKWGVKGVKVDFFDSDKQPVIQRYFDIMREAADHKIMVNFHGSTLPRGWERTYPHLMSMEAIKGAEGAGRQEFCDRAPEHNTIVPFTRNAVGSMDYTPVIFTNKRDAVRKTSAGHELALSIVFESGQFHFADRMTSYQALPDAPKNFLKQVPVAWDETRLLDGVPGEYLIVARRQGTTWYVGGINGQNSVREVTFALPMAAKSLSVITDGTEAGSFATLTKAATNRQVKLTMQPRGGFVATAK